MFDLLLQVANKLGFSMTPQEIRSVEVMQLLELIYQTCIQDIPSVRSNFNSEQQLVMADYPRRNQTKKRTQQTISSQSENSDKLKTIQTTNANILFTRIRPPSSQNSSLMLFLVARLPGDANPGTLAESNGLLRAAKSSRRSLVGPI